MSLSSFSRKRPLSIDSSDTVREDQNLGSFDLSQKKIRLAYGTKIPVYPKSSDIKKNNIRITPIVESSEEVGNAFLIASDKGSFVFKPAFGKNRAESSLRTAVPYEEMAFREKIADIINRESARKGYDLGVPATKITQIHSKHFPEAHLPKNRLIVGSLHAFKPNLGTLGSKSREEQFEILQTESEPSTRDLRKIMKLDIVTANTDGGPHNILINGIRLVPIDHALTLSQGLKDRVKFVWLHAKSSKQPFSAEERRWIDGLDFPSLQRSIVRQIPGIDKQTLESLNTTVEFLKAGAAEDLTPYELGSLMYKPSYTSPFAREPSEDKSFLEYCLQKAKSLPGNFSDNISTVLKSRLAPCALALKEHRDQTEQHKTSSLTQDPRSPVLITVSKVINQLTPEETSFTMPSSPTKTNPMTKTRDKLYEQLKAL